MSFDNIHVSQSRLSRGRSKERMRKLNSDAENEQSDYAGDISDQSASASPLTQSPRHRVNTVTDSPLTRTLRNPLKPECSKIVQSLKRQSTIGKEFPSDVENETKKLREAELKKHTFYQLKILLVSGHNLIAMDKSGEYFSNI